MLGMIAALRVLRDQPERVTVPIDQAYAIVWEEPNAVQDELPEEIIITKSYNLGGVEIYYERSWRDASGNKRIGIPIFNLEDRIAGTRLFGQCRSAMGILPRQAEDANIAINPGLGTTDEEGRLIPDRMRVVVKAVSQALLLLHRYSRG